MSKVSQAVIMVGGKGTRLRPLTDTMPKPILPVLDRPCLSYLIASMAEGGIEHVILACGYRSELMAETIGDGSEYGIEIEYSYEDVPMGTAGAIKLLEDRLDDVFVAANGDVFASFDLMDEIKTHRSSRASVTISLKAVENPCEFGIARVDDEYRILEFKEKPKPEEVFSDLINSGIYVIDKDVMEHVPEGKMYDFSKELVPDLMRTGHRIQGHMMDGIWIDVGRPSDLIRANLVMAGMVGNGPGKASGSYLSDRSYIGAGSIVERSEMNDSVVLGGSTVKDSVLSGSLILPGCSIENCNITNSIIGRNNIILSSTVTDDVTGDGLTIKDGRESQ